MKYYLMVCLSLCAWNAVAQEPDVTPAENPSVDTSVAISAPVGAGVNDTLVLEATKVTGNRELPKVLSIVPWKSSLPPSLSEHPENSLIEDIVSPVDRDEFHLNIKFFDASKQAEASEASEDTP